ncbi:hypothetical protein C8F04DRAFT_227060 [Mycena alexandri]|uniref:Uncharacterized protein n=1 Tax=Mycena alexandri TaxID=1745969 RepID=A0AAD6T7A5_9AGAR|nr:hypothetical protein C8F04DRAFT_227060 [Mycena alexandri]
MPPHTAASSRTLELMRVDLAPGARSVPCARPQTRRTCVYLAHSAAVPWARRVRLHRAPAHAWARAPGFAQTRSSFVQTRRCRLPHPDTHLSTLTYGFSFFFPVIRVNRVQRLPLQFPLNRKRERERGAKLAYRKGARDMLRLRGCGRGCVLERGGVRRGGVRRGESARVRAREWARDGERCARTHTRGGARARSQWGWWRRPVRQRTAAGGPSACIVLVWWWSRPAFAVRALASLMTSAFSVCGCGVPSRIARGWTRGSVQFLFLYKQTIEPLAYVR